MNGPAACDPDKKQAAHIGNTNASGKASKDQHHERTKKGKRKMVSAQCITR